MGEEISPGPSVSTDEEWETWLAQNSYTEYHPSCSCAMLPLSQGGVVDANLMVYGLSECLINMYLRIGCSRLLQPTCGSSMRPSSPLNSPRT